MLQRLAKGVRRRIWQLRYPRHYWHMRHYDSRFALRRMGGVTEILWSGAVVARSKLPAVLGRSGGTMAIVASGPSLLATPPDAWQDNDIACVNGSILWAKERNLRPRLYVVSDPGFVKRRLDLIALAAEISDCVCLTTRCLFEVLRQRPHLFANKPLFVCENINQPFGRVQYTRIEMSRNPRILVDPDRTYEDRFIGVSSDLDLGVFAGGTVVLAAAQLAIALGYREVQFLGLDMKQSAGQHRFYAEGRPEPSFIDRNLEGLILPSFEALRHYCDRQGIRLSNWSPDSAIPRHLVPQAKAG